MVNGEHAQLVRVRDVEDPVRKPADQEPPHVPSRGSIPERSLLDRGKPLVNRPREIEGQFGAMSLVKPDGIREFCFCLRMDP